MKKFMTIVAALMLGAALMTGCGAAKKAPSEAETVTVNVAALKGPTAMGMVDFMDKSEHNSLTEYTYRFEIAAAADEVTPKLVQGRWILRQFPQILRRCCTTIQTRASVCLPSIHSG